MNHLREVIDAIESGKLSVAIGAVLEEKESFFQMMIPRVAERAICFYADVDNLEGIKPVEDLCKKMPFDVCWFEFQAQEISTIFGILTRSFDDGIYFYVFRRMDGRWCFLATIHTDNIQIRSSVGDFKDKSHKEQFPILMLSLVRTFLTAMRCNNVEKNETKPSEKLQKARTKRGKKPLFSFWTLALRQSGSEGATHGGTHSSPRLHLRRGHPRQYSPGKWTWVQPCVVGNKELGMVHKDYALKGAVQ